MRKSTRKVSHFKNYKTFATKENRDYKFKQLCRCCKTYYLVKRVNNLRMYCPNCIKNKRYDAEEEAELKAAEKRIEFEKKLEIAPVWIFDNKTKKVVEYE